MSDPKLIFEFSRNGKANGTTVTARIDDEIIACDRGDVAKERFRHAFVASICKDRPGIRQSEVERALLSRAAEYAKQHAAADARPDEPDGQALLQQMPQHVREEARAMLEAPDLMQRVLDDVDACGVAGERGLVESIYLVGTSRKLPHPLAVIVLAPSSTGKSFVVKKTADLMPPESVILATSITPQALFYMEQGSLRHKFVVAGERSHRQDDESADATKQLREMISEGRLSKLAAEKQGGHTVTQHTHQEGPIAFIESTSCTRIFDEDKNRCLLFSADERPEQTRAVVMKLAKRYGGATTNIEPIIQKHHAAQRMLKQSPVVVPFAEQIAERFDCERVEARRAMGHLLSMIEASALLHQFQRKLDSDSRIIAAEYDYVCARRLCSGPLARLLGGGVSEAAKRFYDRLRAWASDTFSTTEAYKRDRKTSQAVRNWLSELAEAGAVEQVKRSKGNRAARWRLTDIDPRQLDPDFGLPATLSELCGV